MKNPDFRFMYIICAVIVGFAFSFGTAFGHCDTMDGPVVKAAIKALQTGNVNFVLIWVQEKDESEIKELFNKTLKLRTLGPEAKEIADMYFFETLVRIHRAGEGAPYTGLKPAGSHVEPGVSKADEAVEKGSTDELLKGLTAAMSSGLAAYFKEIGETANYDPSDLPAGRKHVEAYVKFIHYVERLHLAITEQVTEHAHESK